MKKMSQEGSRPPAPGAREYPLHRIKATVTIKISRTVRDHITSSTCLNEPIDRTLRRLLKLKIPLGDFPPRTPRAPQENPPSTTTVKVTQEVHDYITTRAKWNESIDDTLRRMLKLKPAAPATAPQRRVK